MDMKGRKLGRLAYSVVAWLGFIGAIFGQSAPRLKITPSEKGALAQVQTRPRLPAFTDELAELDEGEQPRVRFVP